MSFDAILGLVRDVAMQYQKTHLLGMEGKYEEAVAANKAMVPLIEKCLKSKLTFCFYLERKMPVQDNQYFSATSNLVSNWPSNGKSGHDRDPAATHVHVTFVYAIEWSGHIEVRPEGIKTDFVQYPSGHNFAAGFPGQGTVPPAEGGVLTPREMEKFLKDLGLGDIDK